MVISFTSDTFVNVSWNLLFHSSNECRSSNAPSLTTVISQSANVLSPGILNCLPRQGTTISPTVDAGMDADLHGIIEASKALVIF